MDKYKITPHKMDPIPDHKPYMPTDLMMGKDLDLDAGRAPPPTMDYKLMLLYHGKLTHLHPTLICG